MDITMHAMPPAAEACYTKIGPTIHEWELRNLVKLVVDELHPHHIVELGTYRGCYLVYVNNGDGTRDFVGYIREITGAPSGVYWVTVAAYRGNGRSYDAYTGQRHDTKYQAAKLLFDIQRAGSRFTDVKKAKLHWRMSEH